MEKTLAALGFELVDLEYKTQYGQKNLIVYIAGDKPVTLNDCELVSNALDDPLDELDPTGNEPYCLDVSSAGLDRPFKTQRDYERNYGEKIELKLYAPIDGSKTKLLVGTLVSRDDDVVVIETDGKQTSVKNSLIALARPYLDF